MNKTDEELNLAETMAKRYGVRMCDENGDTHGEELYCVGIDDIADIIREARAELDLIPVLTNALEALVYHTEQTRPIHKTNETISQIKNFCKVTHINPIKHTTADNYDHFLAYMHGSGARHNAFLCQAYFDGADAPHEEYEAYMAVHPEPVKQESVAWIALALEALIYHTQQTRPIQKTDEAIIYLQNLLNKQEQNMTFTLEDAIKKFPEIAYWHSEFEKHNTVTAPVSAKREWVELTDDEILKSIRGIDGGFEGFRALIAAFKEKNK